MNTISNKSTVVSPLELNLLRVAKEFEKKDSTKVDEKSRIGDMKLCIDEMHKHSDMGYTNFIISLKTWTVDLFREDLLLDREEVSHAVFMYPFCKKEALYRIVLDDSDSFNGSITQVDRDEYREIIKRMSKKSKRTIAIGDSL